MDEKIEIINKLYAIIIAIATVIMAINVVCVINAETTLAIIKNLVCSFATITIANLIIEYLEALEIKIKEVM